MPNPIQPSNNPAEASDANLANSASTANRVSIDKLNVGFDTDGGFVHAVRGRQP